LWVQLELGIASAAGESKGCCSLPAEMATYFPFFNEAL
ncbi:unnamed protein product, partial [Tetraodon nigroviridis]